MPEAYSPIMRTFCRFRAALARYANVPRSAIRPDTPLDSVLPVTWRAEIWRELKREGWRLPGLRMSKEEMRWNDLGLALVIGAFALCLVSSAANLLINPGKLLRAYRRSRHRARHFPLCLQTVGDLVLFATCYYDHKQSGYRWTKNEIATKVRLLIAYNAGVGLDRVLPETRFAEL